MTFAELNLSSWLVQQCTFMGLKYPTPIQQNCIPRILAGTDCIGCAKTGSGKTLAFALPILQKLSEDPYGIFALVLTPTRELAFQIADQFSAIGKSIGLKKCIIVGGMDMVVQGLELSKHPHIVVATPGRLADHLESCNTFSLKQIKFLVLDEADRLLEGYFDDQLKTIFEALPKQKQILLFSATMTDTLHKVKHIVSNKAFIWESKDESGIATVKELNQHYVLCPRDIRDSFLVEVIRTFRANNKNGSIIIFTDTCKHCQILSMTLNDVGFKNVALHSMVKQKDRLAALVQFKSNHIKILIATDVAARGLDIPTVELIINHIIPNVPKEYIHRVGRTARAGKSGMAITLITPHDIKLLHAIENTIGTKLTEYKINDKEIITILTQISVAKREAEMKLDETNFYEKKIINKRKKLILEGKDPDEIEEILEKKKCYKLKKKQKIPKNSYNKNKL
ncbi:ATP-dependent RNA helicase DDX49 isoform X1 [Apis mellifera caucasica]|uniref:RNA helicase n=1 Tax=Apis mellifera TaxID=7460 RepID=A0A7M7KY12_APIME|nr:probable ATP-dependent RNA helicase DDX49 isoform X1 [Apis mellifera]KAG6803453.1 ATP-dependent RNA helicase DDX49 isoform X1 [Apis mellifera caucasica]KAG9435417.1 ATP-dependent RNA helicase DDX49 isoform X1 [Apis mellifera carnica]|eukprot:XP_026294799.1 probable ATP-dependent RNA helicase DDX49 isoform X1 [Apis mellifera]